MHVVAEVVVRVAVGIIMAIVVLVIMGLIVPVRDLARGNGCTCGRVGAFVVVGGILVTVRGMWLRVRVKQKSCTEVSSRLGICDSTVAKHQWADAHNQNACHRSPQTTSHGHLHRTHLQQYTLSNEHAGFSPHKNDSNNVHAF